MFVPEGWAGRAETLRSAMVGSLRDELASLKIDRDRDRDRGRRGITIDDPLLETSTRRRRGEGGMRLVSALLWLIPIGLLAGAGSFAYRQYDQLRAKPSVSV